MSSETFGDPPRRSTDRAFLDALQRYVDDGHPVSSHQSLDPDAPSFGFTVEGVIFEGYLVEAGVDPDGED